jgi:hypothetical protein
LTAQLPLQDPNLMTQRQNLRVLLPIAHREQAQYSERIRYRQIREPQQHNQPSSPNYVDDAPETAKLRHCEVTDQTLPHLHGRHSRHPQG